MEALFPLIGALISGGSVSAAFTAITTTQWIEIGIAVLAAEPKIRAAFAALHPALSEFVADLDRNIAAGMDQHKSSAHAHSVMMESIARNADAAIRVQEAMEGRGR